MKDKIIEYNMVIQTAGKILSAGLGFITVGLLTRYLGESGYGIYTIVFVYLSIFGIIGEMGLQLTMVRELNKLNSNKKTLIGTYLGLKIFLAAIMIIASIGSLIFFPYSAAIKGSIVIATFGYALGVFNTFGSTLFQAKVRLDLVTLSDLISRLIATLFIGAAVYFNLGINVVLLAILFGNAGSLIFNIIKATRFYKIEFVFESHQASLILRKSIPVALMTLLSLAYFKIDTVILSFYRPSDEVGLYGLVYKIFENLLVLWGFYMASVYPMLSAYALRDEPTLKKIWTKSLKIALIFSFAVVLVGFFTAEWLILLFGGEGFLGSVISLRITLFSLPFFYLNNLFFHTFLAKERNIIPIAGMLISLFFNLVLCLIFIPKYGYVGASAITVFTEILLFFSYLLLSKKYKVSI